MQRRLCAALSAAATWVVFGPGQSLAAAPSPEVKPAPLASAEGKPAAAQRIKGNQSGVVVRPSVPDKMAVGETAVLRLQISGVTAADGATVEVRDLAARVTVLTARLAQGEQRTLELPYTGRADGMQFIDVITTQAGRSTVQTVPIRVGSGELKLKPQGQRSTTADGQAVISLPAATPGSSR